MPEIATFTVTLSSVSGSACSVGYATSNLTATAGTDYTATVGTLTFAPGVTTGTIVVPVLADPTAIVDKSFHCQLSAPVGCTLVTATNTCVISTAGAGSVYLTRFNWIYGKVKDSANGYFGPSTGPKAFQMPYHSVEKLIAEAPDWGHESVSETASYWAKLEAWQVAMNASTTGYAACWASIDSNYVPSATNQPWGAYTPASPGTYTPEGDQPSDYPTLPDPLATTGADPLATPLQTAYGTLNVYLMHWLYDVDGVFGMHNGDGTTLCVAINNYSRGMHEGLFQTITHAAWDDWTNGGNAYGYLPIFGQSTPTYPAAPFAYAKQFSYTCAPDAEVRAIASAWLANKFAAAQSLSVATQDAKAKKLGDYLRYCLYDKYFKGIPGYDGSGAHNLISWYAAFGGDAGTTPGTWGYRIGSSESHFGYNGVDCAYAMATAGGGYSPSAVGSGTQWQNSVQRQLELIRWLQSPEGPIAGGVTNSWKGRYETPTDGRQSVKFYGLLYTYSPVWHSPPSNNWAGYQAWGLERVAALYLATAAKTDTFSANIRANCKVILDKFVPWLLTHSSLISTTSFSIPTTLGWTSATQVSGQTTTAPNIDGVYEFLPSLNWDSTGDYGAFWSASSVPSPHLHCSIVDSGVSLGVAAAFAQLLIEYAHARRTTAGGALADTIPLSSKTYNDAYLFGKGLLDAIWNGMKDTIGFANPEVRADYTGYGAATYVPALYSGHMKTGEAISPSGTTFLSTRNFLTTAPGWASIAAYLAGGAAPTFTYHRFWEQCEVAAGFAMLHQYFADLGD